MNVNLFGLIFFLANRNTNIFGFNFLYEYKYKYFGAYQKRAIMNTNRIIWTDICEYKHEYEYHQTQCDTKIFVYYGYKRNKKYAKNANM